MTRATHLLEMAEANLSPGLLLREWRRQVRWGWGDPGIQRVRAITESYARELIWC